MLHLRNHGIASVFFVLSLFITHTTHAATSTPEPSEEKGQDWSIAWIDPQTIEPFELIGEKEKTTLAAYKGKVVLMNFWAIWCPPCVEELPSMAKLQQEYGNKGIQVIAVTQDNKGFTNINPFWEKHQLQAIPVFWDERAKLMFSFSIKGLPTTLIFDREGKLRGKLEGSVDWQSEYFQTFVKERLLTLH